MIKPYKPMGLIHCFFSWLGKLTNTFILVPHPITIGNYAEEIYYGLLKARRENLKLVILFPYEFPYPIKMRVTNPELSKIESSWTVNQNTVMNIAGNIFITILFGFLRILDFFLEKLFKSGLRESLTIPMIGQDFLWKPYGKMDEFSWDIVREYHWKEQISQEIDVHLNHKKKTFCEAQRKKMGLPEDAWFVCLHVRESGFHGDHQTTERNADINNYIPAIDEIISRGGWVVRLGDPSMTRLPNMENVIDYPFTEFKSNLMDLYLISECYAYMGMQSGIFDVAVLFQRPVILTNMSNWLFPFPQKKCDIGIFKHIYSNSKKRFLSVEEWLLEPWKANAFSSNLDGEYKVYENSPDELKNTVIDFFERQENPEIDELQNCLNDLRKIQGKSMIDQVLIPGDFYSDIHTRYRLASRLNSASGVISSDFLKKNWKEDINNNILN